MYARPDILDALSILTPEDRQLLLLRESARLSYNEIARTLGISRELVAGRLSGARQKILRALDMNAGAPRQASEQMRLCES